MKFNYFYKLRPLKIVLQIKAILLNNTEHENFYPPKVIFLNLQLEFLLGKIREFLGIMNI